MKNKLKILLSTFVITTTISIFSFIPTTILKADEYINIDTKSNVDEPESNPTLTTTIDSGTVLGMEDYFASEITTNNIKLPNAIISANLVKNLPPDVKYLYPADLKIISIKSANDIIGELILDIKIINDKGWINGIKQDVLVQDVKITGFKTRTPTTFNEPIISNSTFKNYYANNFNDNQIIHFVINNKELFANNLPIDFQSDDFKISNIKRNNKLGEITFTLGLAKYYSSVNGLLVSDSGTFLTQSFKLIGFENRDTSLKNNTINLKDLNLDINPFPTLDSNVIDNNFIINLIVSNAQLIFNDAPDVINESNINIIGSPIKSIYNGQLDVEFTLTNALPQEKQFKIKIIGFTAKETSFKNNITKFQYGNETLKASEINEQWIKNKVIENKNEMFVNVPDIYDFNSNLSISNIDKHIDKQLSFRLILNNVYTKTGKLEANVTFTGFRTNAIINTYFNFSEIRYQDKIFKKIFNDEKGFLIDWESENKFTKNAELLKQYISDNLNNLVINANYFPNSNTTINSLIIERPVKGSIASIKATMNDWVVNDEQRDNVVINLKLILRSTPTSSDVLSWIEPEIFAVMTKYDNEDKPNHDEIKNAIVRALNKNLNNIPNVMIPDSNRFDISDFNSIQIDVIDKDTVNISGIRIGNGGQTINLDDIVIKMPKIYRQKMLLWISISLIVILSISIVIACILSAIKNKHYKDMFANREKYSDN